MFPRKAIYKSHLLMLACTPSLMAPGLAQNVELTPAVLQSPHGRSASDFYIYNSQPHWTQPSMPSGVRVQEVNYVPTDPVPPKNLIAQPAPKAAAPTPGPSAATSTPPASQAPLSQSASPVPSASPAPSTTAAASASTAVETPPIEDKAITEAIRATNLHILDVLKAGDWQSSPAEHFQGVGRTFVTASGANLPNPGGESAEALREYGCTHVFVKKFWKPQRNATIAMFYFPETRGAFGAYSIMRQGSSNVVVRGDASSEDDDSISFLKGNYLFKLSNSAGEDEVSKDLITGLATQLNEAVSGKADVPPLVSTLPGLDRLRGSEKFFMGPVTARRFTLAPFVGQLFTAKFSGAALADYIIPPPQAERLKLLVVDYENPETAKGIYDSYIELVSASHKPTLETPTSQLFKSNNSFVFCQLRGKKIALISGARRKAAPLMLARMIP
jgi:hypothetical protein